MTKKTQKDLDKSAAFVPSGSKKRHPKLATSYDPSMDAASVRALRPRTFQEIREQMITQLKTTMGPSIDTGPGSTIGALIGAQATQLAHLEEHMVSVMRDLTEPVITLKGTIDPAKLDAIANAAISDHRPFLRPLIVPHTGTITVHPPKRSTRQDIIDAAFTVEGVLQVEVSSPTPGAIAMIIVVETSAPDRVRQDIAILVRNAVEAVRAAGTKLHIMVV